MSIFICAHSSSTLLCFTQWVIQLKTHDGKEFLIQAPDEKSRSEWSTPIEECIRRLDPTKVHYQLLLYTIGHDRASRSIIEHSECALYSALLWYACMHTLGHKRASCSTCIYIYYRVSDSITKCSILCNASSRNTYMCRPSS